MSKPDAWMPLYVGDYLADTTRFTCAEHGAYLLLIMDYWRNGPPPDDDAILAQIARCNAADWRKVRAAVLGKFTLEDGKLTHGRIDSELAEAAERKASAVAKAKQAADKRWHAASNTPSSATSMPQAMLEQCPSPSPSPSSLRSDKSSRQRAARIPDDFAITDRLRAWGVEKGYGSLEAYLETFVGRHKASGKKYLDWEQTFMNCVREDWYEVRKKPMVAAVAWWASDAGIEAKAAELGLSPRAGESWQSLKGRINQRLERAA